MKYKKIPKEYYNLHLIETDKFKNINIRVTLKSPSIKDKIIYRNILLDVLTESSKKYPVKKELVKAAQNLYAANIYTRAYRLGNLDIINFNLSLLDEKYTEQGMFDKSIELLSEIIFNPNVTNNFFDEYSFNFVLRENKEIIKNIKDSKNKYSTIKMLEIMGKDKKYAYNEYGYLEDFKTINKNNLYEYYKKILNESEIDIYILGNINKYNVEEIFDKYMKFKNNKIKYQDILLKHEYIKKDEIIIKEKDNINQSNLVIGCKIFDLTKFERNYAITLYNIILGSGGESKLFKNIREEHSLCYYISSSINKFDNIMLIKSGISKENFDKVIQLIKNNMEDMIKGNFTDKDIYNAKKYYSSYLEELKDSDDAIIQTYIASDLLDLENLEQRNEMIEKVTKEDIINVAKKIKIDTIYLLEGDKNERV